MGSDVGRSTYLTCTMIPTEDEKKRRLHEVRKAAAILYCSAEPIGSSFLTTSNVM